MPIHRIIFRLDFGKPNYDLLNTPGTVMRLMSEMGEKFWDEHQDSPQTRAVSSIHSEKDKLYYRMVVEPAQLNFEVEHAEGLRVDKLEESPLIASLFKGVQTICDHYKVDHVLRAGFRVVYWSTLGQNSPKLGGAFRKTLDAALQSNIESSIGAINDWGYHFDGESADKIKYHFRFGPYNHDEARRYLPKLHASLSKQYNLMVDLDLYEENFALKGGRASQWVVPLLARTQKLLKGIESTVDGKL